MAFRSVIIASEAEVRLRAGQLVIQRDDRLTVPVEDIAVLVLENPQVTVSAAVLSALSAAGAAVIVCDRQHRPAGLLNGVCPHSRQYAIAKAQIALTQPFRKRTWQTLVRSKVQNQAACLDRLGLEGGPRLREHARRVNSGDTGGIEAAAARYYFTRLMPGSRRHSGGVPDGALDYGYAVVRALLSRLLVSHGLYPPLGIHHANEFNAFNLADDLLEPYRPLVDLLACRTSADVSKKEGRQTMAGILHEPCTTDGARHTVLTAAEKSVVSLQSAVLERSPAALALPSLAASSSLA